jgi:hypothetical protein
MDEDKSTILDVVCISIGSYLLGSEFTAAVGWGIWLIAMAIT